MARYAAWKSETSSEAWPSSEASIHEVSSSVPLYPIQWTRYNNWQAQHLLLTLESRILEILNSGSSSTMMGGGGGWTWSGMGLGFAGSNIETWKTGCTVRKLSGSCKVIEWVPGHARISYGPRNLSESFLEGHVVQKN